MPQRIRRSSIPTITDVAGRAGVSVSTVSKALSGTGNLRPETRARVAEAATELGYRSNALARSLLSGRSFTVGLITNDSFGRFAMPVLLAAEDTLQIGQMAVLLCDGRDDPERERHYLDTLLDRRVDGIIVTGRRDDPRPPVSQHLPIPVVYAMCESTDPDDVSVLPDDEGGGRLAVEHLLDLGRTTIGHVTGPRDFRAVGLRARGALAALEEAGLDVAGGTPRYGEWSEAWGRRAAEELLEAAPGVDAIFCGSDQIGRGVSEALRDLGRRVPDDVAIIGFDNWTVMAEACRPPLTTVDLALDGIGRMAAELLLAAIGGGVEPGVRLVPCSLVARESTGARVPSSASPAS